METILDPVQRHARDPNDQDSDGVEQLQRLVRIPSPNSPGDTRALARGDMIIFGPGSYVAAHGVDEHVMLAEYQATTRILLDFLRRTLHGGH